MNRFNLLAASVFLSLLWNCKEPEKQLTVPEKIANANGITDWSKVKELHFTFNVERGSTHFERSWIWDPTTDDVTMMMGDEKISYNRNEVDSTLVQTDQGFINDSYWLLAPYKLVWDEGMDYEPVVREPAPISNDSLNRLTITYVGDGGYTPGDGYDFYYDDNYIIREWVYRENNTSAVCMMTTWEDYKNYHGLNLATMHQDDTGYFRLFFTDIEVVENTP
ncbi:hypothetical protein [Robertkochia solimangrovi]|uniref:hypothetical protein n=1 Tax=Robertkochia solimangrovi TaxID=2213046 RepID=UPI00117FBAB2|nr:hypothetical protein [Robertkochia solimangrovi]TRZ41428.1 hypothetical protein DMZ48_17235 [Robertkochia solimangrovi]